MFYERMIYEFVVQDVGLDGELGVGELESFFVGRKIET